MSKIVWIADGGVSTGFARVTHAIGERLVTEYGHEIHVIAANYKGDPYPSVDNPTPLGLYVPDRFVPKDIYGQSRFLELLRDVDPDVVVMLNDPNLLLKLLLENRYDAEQLLVKYRPILAYVPVDGHNHPTEWQQLSLLTNIVAMSRFGQNFFPGSKMVYHGVDADAFWPVSSQRPITLSNGDVLKTKAQCKEAVGLPKDAFIVGRVDRNSGRKDFPALWKALQPVQKKYTDVVAYYHCKPQHDESGIDLFAIFSREPETLPRQRVPGNLNPYHGYKQQDLNALYNAFDVFVSTSRGEGFGLTIAEALACGVPVIAQNVSAIPEVVGPGGALIDPEREITVPFGHDQWLSNIGAFTEAIEHAYLSSGWRREKGKAGRAHVEKSFRWDDAAASFHEYITLLSEAGEAQEVPTDADRDPAPVTTGG